MTTSILKIIVTWQRKLMWPEQNHCDQPEDDVHFSREVSDWIYPNLESIFHLFLAGLESENDEILSFTFRSPNPFWPCHVLLTLFTLKKIVDFLF